ncbi:hypothetical protein [Phormidium nigroviride]
MLQSALRGARKSGTWGQVSLGQAVIVLTVVCKDVFWRSPSSPLRSAIASSIALP